MSVDTEIEFLTYFPRYFHSFLGCIETAFYFHVFHHMFHYSDGRVTEETASLIKGLLVLSPRKRITASEILITLERTMNMW